MLFLKQLLDKFIVFTTHESFDAYADIDDIPPAVVKHKFSVFCSRVSL
jgi:hypothetical protein